MAWFDTLPSIEDTSHVLEFQRSIPTSLSGVLQYMRIKFKSLNAEKDLGGWSQFLEEDASPSVTGTSCVISSMCLCEENRNSGTFISAKNFIISKQRLDGGWSKPSLEMSHSLVLTTCQALAALLDASEFPASVPFQAAVHWLLEAQNSDGGWGFLANDKKSDVTSTAQAMKTLARVMSFYPKSKDATANGQKWLEEVKNQDASWGRCVGQSGTLAHTSHAVEALLALGIHASTLTSTRDWIEKNYHNCTQFQDLYKVPATPERLSWSHMSNERTLIALLKLGAPITASAIIEGIQSILDRQSNGTYWANDLNTYPGASWAILEAVTTLNLYLRRLESEAPVIILKTELSKWEHTITEYDKRISLLEERLASHSLKGWTKQLVSFLNRPGIALGSLTALLLLVYLLLRLVFDIPGIVDVYIAILTIVSFVIALVEIRGKKRHQDEAAKTK